MLPIVDPPLIQYAMDEAWVSARRAGDIATSVARVDKARDALGWRSSHTLDDIYQSSWNWQSRNPEGYGGDAA